MIQRGKSPWLVAPAVHPAGNWPSFMESKLILSAEKNGKVAAANKAIAIFTRAPERQPSYPDFNRNSGYRAPDGGSSRALDCSWCSSHVLEETVQPGDFVGEAVVDGVTPVTLR